MDGGRVVTSHKIGREKIKKKERENKWSFVFFYLIEEVVLNRAVPNMAPHRSDGSAAHLVAGAGNHHCGIGLSSPSPCMTTMDGRRAMMMGAPKRISRGLLRRVCVCVMQKGRDTKRIMDREKASPFSLPRRPGPAKIFRLLQQQQSATEEISGWYNMEIMERREADKHYSQDLVLISYYSTFCFSPSCYVLCYSVFIHVIYISNQ